MVFPPTMAGWSLRSSGTTQSSVMLVNGACEPQRDGVLTPNTNDWMHCLTSANGILLCPTNGAR